MAHLLHDDGEDQSRVDLCLLRDFQNGIVDGALFWAAIEMHQRCLLVEHEHVVIVHPVFDRWEVLLYPVETKVEVGILVPLASGAEGWVEPLQAVGTLNR